MDTVYPDGEKEYGDNYYPKKVYGELRNADGGVICEYYYNRISMKKL